MEARAKRCMLGFVFLGVSLSLPGVVFAEFSIIANKGISVDSVTAAEAKKIWLGRKKSMPGGGVVKISDLPVGNEVRKEFYSTVVKKKDKQLKAYWAKITFTGKGYPPKLFDSETEVVEWVANTQGAMGYVSSAAVNDSVNVLLTK